MGRAPCCEKSGLKKGPWTTEEDQKLIDYISKNGYGNWRTLPMNAGLERCGKSCRLRWTNYLRPDIKRGRFSFEEEDTIIQLHRILGNKWSAIASRLPGRTDNEIKNYWNTHIRKRLLRMGIDPVTHSPRLDLLDLNSILYHNNLNSSMLMAMHQSDNPVGNFNGRMIQDEYYYDIQHELGHHDIQKEVTEHEDSYYVPIPFNDFYNQNQNLSNSHFLGQSKSTSSSSPNSNIYMNSSCNSIEDEKEIDNSKTDYCSNDFVKMMKFDIPDQIFDVNEFIC